MSGEASREEQDGIAIIGIAARMPGAPDVDSFWRNLCAGVESISGFSEAELIQSGQDLTSIRHPDFVAAKGILEDVDLFDANFFGIAPREAELMDPQHRLMMECAWEAMEHAGHDPAAFPGRIAVFTSAGMNTYFPFNLLPNRELMERVGGFQLSIFNDKDFVPTRIAYAMNVDGPGVDIGTACSSSLVSLHFACQHLLTYQADMVLVGAVTVHLPQKVGHVAQEGAAYSPDRHCRPFDATPSGLIDGNGMATIVLKRLADALADGDTVHAIVKGTAINNDGSRKLGYTAPSIDGQAKVIIEAQAMAQCDPDSITYVEAHGTATPLGDPVEVAALAQAFRAGTKRTGYCGLGSVKSNIGHVDKAAGLAGLIKTALALKHEKIPPTLHFKAPNPKLNLPQTPFYVVDRLTPWPRDPDRPRRAGVSSFGVGGTNAHAILEEPPLPNPGSASRPVQLLSISAKSEAALQQATENLAAFLKAQPNVDLADVCHTLHRGRSAFAWRRAVPCTNVAEALAALCSGQNGRYGEPGDRRVGFLFPGQGSQYVGMAQGLYAQEPIFRAQVDACAQLLEPDLGLDIRALLFPSDDDRANAGERLGRTEFTQPALFIIEYALARLWMAWGIQPTAMIGHSLGEYVAACLSGVFSLEDALKVIAARGRLMQAMAPGAMLSVAAPWADMTAWLTEGLDLAAANAPQQSVVSGPEAAISALQAQLASAGIAATRLHTSHAFHSAMMEPALAPFLAVLRGVRLNAPTIPFVSNVTGTWITPEQATAQDYWAEQLRRPVRFAEGIAQLLNDGVELLVEIGPGRTLGGLAAQAERNTPTPCVASLPTARETRTDHAVLLSALAEFWTRGGTVNWAAFYQDQRRLRLPLPTYPFQRRRYWIDASPRQATTRGDAAPATAKGTDPAGWFYRPVWHQEAPLPTSAPDAARWLLFADSHGVSDAMAADIAGSVVTVRHGAAFAVEGPSSYTLDPSRADDFTRLCDELMAADRFPDKIAFLWTYGATGATAAAADSLTFLILALHWLALDRPVELVLIADRMCDIAGETQIDPAQAALLGLMRTLPWELPMVRGRAIDLPAITKAADTRQLARMLLREAGVAAPQSLTAWRGGQRWGHGLAPLSLPMHVGGGLIKADGVYVVMGGLDALALGFTRRLAEHGPVRLALVGHSPDPHELSASAAVAELIAKGCPVEIIPVDVGDPATLDGAFQRIENRFGPINGVIHCADMGDGRLVRLIKDLERAPLAPLAEQLQTAQSLATCLEGRAVDFCLIMSSLAADIGGIGQTAHAMAAAGLDAFAHHQGWMVLNWDQWTAETTTQATGPARLAITPTEGLECFHRLLASEIQGRILIATTDPRHRLALLGTASENSRDRTSPAGPTSGHQRPDLAVAYVAPRTAVERALADLWQDVLGITQVGIHDNFFDLGGHSLYATQLVSRLRQIFGMNVELDRFFAAPTIAGFAAAMDTPAATPSPEPDLTALLDRLDTMTEAEVEALLASGDLPDELLASLGSVER